MKGKEPRLPASLLAKAFGVRSIARLDASGATLGTSEIEIAHKTSRAAVRRKLFDRRW
jgi:hypothetical protein